MKKSIFLIGIVMILSVPFCMAQADQSLVYASYFGGSGDDMPLLFHGMDSHTDQWLAGSNTTSWDIPITNDAFQSALLGGVDGLVSIFSEFGILEYSSYYGGSGNDFIHAVRYMPGNSGYVLAGTTDSEDLPVSSSSYLNELQGGEDGFLACFSEDHELLWSTYFGGSESDQINTVVVASSGSVYIAGQTFSSGLATSGVHQTTNLSGDAFLAKFDPSGTLVWCTYFGGSGGDEFISIGSSFDGSSIYCAGLTGSSENVAFAGWQNGYGGGIDGIIAKFNTENGTVDWSSYYGGDDYDYFDALVVSEDDGIYISGETQSTSGISSSGAHQLYFAGFSDNFLVRFDAEGNRQWATYYGGELGEGRTTLVLKDQEIILAGRTNSQENITFGNPLYPGPPLTEPGLHVGYMAKFDSTGQIIFGSYFVPDRPLPITGLVNLPGSQKLVGVSSAFPSIDFSDLITSDAFQNTHAGGESDLVFFIFEDNTVSVKSHNIIPLRVYPNPASDVIRVEKPENVTQSLILELTDIKGTTKLRAFIFSSISEIDVSDFASGTYFIKLKTSDNFYGAKLVVQ